MSVLPIACMLSLRAVLALEPQPDSAPFAAVMLSDASLDTVRGTGLPLAGTDQIAAADGASAVPAGFDLYLANVNRDIVDNWTVAVAVPLIAAATEAAR